MKTKTIRQTVTFSASPDVVYRTLLTTRGHAAFTGAPAKISSKVGGEFTAWGDYIHGVNVELVPGKKIVQEWRPTEEDWPEDYYSRVTFEFEPIGGGTRLRFTHSGVPAAHAGHLAAGWKESYWEPLEKYLKAHPK